MAYLWTIVKLQNINNIRARRTRGTRALAPLPESQAPQTLQKRRKPHAETHFPI